MSQNIINNRFSPLLEAEEVQNVENDPDPESLMEILFPCYTGVVGQLAGRNWQYMKDFCVQFREQFEGKNISITYDGCFFRVHVSPYQDCVHFIHEELGRRIAIANQGIIAEPVGAIIGKKGWWLRKTEASQKIKCTIYHEDGCFFVKFPWNVSTVDRIEAMDDIRRKIVGRAKFLNKTFSESDSNSTVSSLDGDIHDIKDFLDGKSPTPAEMHENK